MNYQDFKILHSETILYYQKIEHNLKLIYSHMPKSSVKKSKKDITKRTMGQVLSIIKNLDHSNSSPLLTNNDYIFLEEICENRNIWAHTNFTEFIYIDNFINSSKYQSQCNKLIEDHNKAETAHNLLKNVKTKITSDPKSKT